MGGVKFYAVAVGRTPGVYTDWASAKAQVAGFAAARYKKFDTREAAEDFVKYLGSPLIAQLSRFSGSDVATLDIKPRDPMHDPYSPETLVVFTDGSALGNGKKTCKAGWAMVWPHHPDADMAAKLEGDVATNNRAEFTAFIKALEAADRLDVARTRTLHVYTDSKLLINTVSKWMAGWKKRGWRKPDGKDIANLDLVEKIDNWLQVRTVIWKHVPAHTGALDWASYWNDRVDKAARVVSES